jgi:uncharacterized protein (DUF1778 family)
MKNISSDLKTEQINIRLTKSEKEIITRAAKIFEKTNTDYIIDNITKLAQKDLNNIEERLKNISEIEKDIPEVIIATSALSLGTILSIPFGLIGAIAGAIAILGITKNK